MVTVAAVGMTAPPAAATPFLEPEAPVAALKSRNHPLRGASAEKPLPPKAIPDRTGGTRIIRLQPSPRRKAAPRPVATGRQVATATAWVRQRRGDVAFAVIDEKGRMRGYRANQPYICASVVKAMLLVAYLQRDPTPSPGMRSTLASMIQYSDNHAADTVYRIVGDSGLNRVAKRAGMTNFGPRGWWSLTMITPGDQARFFYTMDRQIPPKARPFARKVLSHISTEQSWGVPKAARPLKWTVFFKGGWRPTDRGQLVHQIARLERGKRKIAIAVMTDGNPSQGYGIATIRGVAARVLR